MSYSDCRASDPDDRMVGARDREFVIFKDSLKVRFRNSASFFGRLLVGHSISIGQLVPNT